MSLQNGFPGGGGGIKINGVKKTVVSGGQELHRGDIAVGSFGAHGAVVGYQGGMRKPCITEVSLRTLLLVGAEVSGTYPYLHARMANVSDTGVVTSKGTPTAFGSGIDIYYQLMCSKNIGPDEAIVAYSTNSSTLRVSFINTSESSISVSTGTIIDSDFRPHWNTNVMMQFGRYEDGVVDLFHLRQPPSGPAPTLVRTRLRVSGTSGSRTVSIESTQTVALSSTSVIDFKLHNPELNTSLILLLHSSSPNISAGILTLTPSSMTVTNIVESSLRRADYGGWCSTLIDPTIPNRVFVLSWSSVDWAPEFQECTISAGNPFWYTKNNTLLKPFGEYIGRSKNTVGAPLKNGYFLIGSWTGGSADAFLIMRRVAGVYSVEYQVLNPVNVAIQSTQSTSLWAYAFRTSFDMVICMDHQGCAGYSMGTGYAVPVATNPYGEFVGVVSSNDNLPYSEIEVIGV